MRAQLLMFIGCVFILPLASTQAEFNQKSLDLFTKYNQDHSFSDSQKFVQTGLEENEQIVLSSRHQRKIARMDRLITKMMGSILEQVGPAFCWKDKIKLPRCPRSYKNKGILCQQRCRRAYREIGVVCVGYCPRTHNDIGTHCQREYIKYTKIGLIRVPRPKIEILIKKKYTPHAIPFTSHKACPSQYYNTRVGQCVPDCNKMYTSVSHNCGPFACASSKRACISGVLGIAKDTIIGAAELTSFVLTAGQSGAAKVAVKSMFKKQMKTGLRKMKRGLLREVAKQSRDFLVANSYEVSTNAVNYLYDHQTRGFFDGIFNTGAFPELKRESEQRRYLREFARELITNQFAHAGANMKRGVSQTVDGVADFMLSGALKDCKASGSSSGHVNNDIACAKGIISTVSNFDPTGVLTIAGAFLHPICGKTSTSSGFGPESCSGTKCSGYRGRQDHTKKGLQCQDWSQQSPHKHRKTTNKFPKAGLKGNYCRNPDGEATIWCYTTDPKKRWDFCEPGPEKCTGEKCSGYRGKQDTTVSGRKCQRWDSNTPHKPYLKALKPYMGNILVHNYCRNPTLSGSTIWCYTTDPKKRWELCRPK